MIFTIILKRLFLTSLVLVFLACGDDTSCHRQKDANSENTCSVTLTTTTTTTTTTKTNTSTSSITVTKNPIPGPFDMAAAVGDGKVTISWTASKDAKSYRIARGLSSGEYSALVSENATSPYVDNQGLVSGIKYYYMVTAENGVNRTNANVESTAIFTSIVVQAQVPGAFNFLAATPGSSKVTLSWTASTDATSYTLTRGTSTGTYNVPLTINATSPYEDTGLTPGTTYYYMVRAVNDGGGTNASAEISATPLP